MSHATTGVSVLKLAESQLAAGKVARHAPEGCAEDHSGVVCD